MPSLTRLRKAIRDRSKRGRELVALYAKESRAGNWRAARTERLERKAKRTGTARDKAKARESRRLLETQRKKLVRYRRAVRLSRIKLHHWRVLYAKAVRAQGPHVKGNKVTGGTPRQRIVKAAVESARRSANGSRRSFYSQSGNWDIKHGISGEQRNDRSDCSSWFTAMYWSAGLSDPNDSNYTGGFTGTLLSGGKSISRSQLKPGDAVIYGPGNGHHVEMYVGPGSRTIGHGSAPVDAGHIDMLGGLKRYRSYL